MGRVVAGKLETDDRLMMEERNLSMETLNAKGLLSDSEPILCFQGPVLRRPFEWLDLIEYFWGLYEARGLPWAFPGSNGLRLVSGRVTSGGGAFIEWASCPSGWTAGTEGAKVSNKKRRPFLGTAFF